MKKFFTLMVIAMTMVVIPAKAQFGYGLRAGVNLTSLSLSAGAANLNSSNRAGFYVGPTVKFIVPIVGVGVDLSAVYDQRNSAISGETVVEKNVFVPINLRYEKGLGSMASVFLKVGPQFGWNIGGKTHEVAADDAGNPRKFTLKDSNMSLNVGLGAMLLSHLEIGVTYNIALGKTGEVSYTDAAKVVASEAIDKFTGKTRTNCWQIGLAYYF